LPLLYLGLGSNLGNRHKNIDQALTLISERVGEILALSKWYETAPDGYTSAHKYLNAVVIAETSWSPEQVLQITQDIEKACGRTQKTIDTVYHDRTIDIDVLLYDNLILQTPHLTIPHPRMHLRAFVLQPLSAIAPFVVHPTLCKTIKSLYEELSSKNSSI
jgi:2-amino-4-hydroxy-6-hydroxymethyldihydropteridine diphosphokinase